MNSVILIGRLTANPELRQTNSGTNTCRFSIAVDRYNKDEPQADFPSIVAFGKNAENIKNFFHKGDMIAITGNLKTGTYEKDGVKHYTTDVWVDRWEFCGSKNDSQRAYPSSQPSPQPSRDNDATYDEVISDGELPF